VNGARVPGRGAGPADPDPPRRAPTTPSATPAQSQPASSRHGLPRRAPTSRASAASPRSQLYGLRLEVNGYGTKIYDPVTGALMASAPLIEFMQPFDIAWEALEAFKTTIKDVSDTAEASDTDVESFTDTSDASDADAETANVALAWTMRDEPVKHATAGGARLAENNTGKTSTGHVKSVVGGGAIPAKNVTTVGRVEPIEGGGVMSAKNVKASAGRVKPAEDVKSAEAETRARKPVENVKTPRKGAGSAGGGSSFRRGTQRRGCAHCECAHCRQSWRSTAPIITQETLW
jgi:hypothetical protein